MATYARTLYIPYINETFTLDMVVQLLENNLQLGKVGLLECIPRTNSTNGRRYNSGFVYFDTYNRDSDNCRKIDNATMNGGGIRSASLCISGAEYMMFSENTSELQKTHDIQPKHMDLTLHVHRDVQRETIHQLMEGLDLGCIHRIENHGGLMEDYISDPDKPVWPHVHRAHWDKFTQNHLVTFVVRYSYWYRTRSATAFQDIMDKQRYVAVPAMDGSTVWTFTERTPLSVGRNPYVWMRNKT